MAQDAPYFPLLTVYFMCLNIIHSNPKASTYWKLNIKEGKIQSALAADDSITNDPLMSILTTRIKEQNGHWTLEDKSSCDIDTCAENKRQKNIPKLQGAETEPDRKSPQKVSHPSPSCGTFVNFTDVDHLKGIKDREHHPFMAEPEVALIFRNKNSKKQTGVDLKDLEKRLRKSRKESPKSPQVYNQLGNFWRIKGNTLMAIECFRKSLHYKAHNPDVFLNLARVLFNLKYLEDAILLTQRSLQLQGPDQNTWLQHFTLAEIYHASGRIDEAIHHFRQALEFNPGFQPAEAWLRDLSKTKEESTFITNSTLGIIASTALFSLLIVLYFCEVCLDETPESLSNNVRNTRHFNRAMAMRSIKNGFNHKLQRMRKMAQTQG